MAAKDYPKTVATYRRFSPQSEHGWVGLGSGGNCPAPHVTLVNATVTTTDTVTLGKSPWSWKQNIAQGISATSGLEGIRHTAYSHSGSYSYYRTKASWPADDQCQRGYAVGALALPAFPSVPTTINAGADQLARSKFLGKCLDARKTWRGGNFLAEVVETIHQLRHPLEGLASGLGAFTKGVTAAKGYWIRGELEAYGKHVSNAWLEWTFGWKPLFDDIRDANAALSRLSDGRYADTKRISATGHVTTVTKPTSEWMSFSGGVANNGAYQDTYSKSTSYVKYTGALKARPENLTSILDNFGVSPSDIVPAVWEAIPWSFFVDYFLNVQEQLDSMQFAFSDFGWCTQGIRNVKGTYYTGAYADQRSVPTHFDLQAYGFDRCAATEYKRRSAFTSVPFPYFRFRLPGLGSLKWVNTAALIQQIRGSSPSGQWNF